MLCCNVKVWTLLHVAQVGWKDGQTEGGMVTRKGEKEEGEEGQTLLIMKMTPVLLPGSKLFQCDF